MKSAIVPAISVKITCRFIIISVGHDGATGGRIRCCERTDRLYVRSLGPREREALRGIEQRPGITIAELAEAMAVSIGRAWQYVGRLEAGRVRRESV